MFSVLVRRPDLLVDHVSGYAALIREEASEAGVELLQRSLAWTLAAMLGLAFLMLTGVALMLGVLMQQFHWVLVAVPAVMLVLTLAAVFKARTPLRSNSFADVKAQIDRDAQALRMVG
ncbi:hypothetical protein [Polaromonas sp.]|uniref:hypothetical protein n=1 Tax=Polaromonas sp. TaxID=1869339 RepID=UPI003263662D